MLTLYRLTCLIISSLFIELCLAQEPTSTAPADTDPAKQELPRSTPLTRNILAAQAIQLGLDAQQLISLSTAREHFSALFIAANHAQPHGLVILLPGIGESFNWPTAIGPLRNKLPDAGWHTLSLNLPPPPDTEIDIPSILAEPVAEQIVIEPPAPAAPIDIQEPDTSDLPEENTTEEAPEDQPEMVEEVITEGDDAALAAEPAAPVIEALPPLTYPERITSFLDAAFDYAKQLQAPEVIILGHHEGAYWALKYAAEQPPAAAPPVVLIAPRTHRQASFSYEKLIEANTSAIADFYYNGDRVTEAAAKQRLQASKRAGLEHYQQIGLTTAHPSIAQEHLFRRVKGWLNQR